MVAAKDVLFAAVLSVVAFALLGCDTDCKLYVKKTPPLKAVYECGATCNYLTNTCDGDECPDCIDRNVLGTGVCGKASGPTPPPSPPPSTTEQCTVTMSEACCAELASQSPFQDSIDTSNAKSCSDKDKESIAGATCKEMPSTGTCAGVPQNVQNWEEYCTDDYFATTPCAPVGTADKKCVKEVWLKHFTDDGCADTLTDWVACNCRAGTKKCSGKCLSSGIHSEECWKCGWQAGKDEGCEAQYLPESGFAAPCPPKYTRLYSRYQKMMRGHGIMAMGLVATAMAAVTIAVLVVRRGFSGGQARLLSSIDVDDAPEQ